MNIRPVGNRLTQMRADAVAGRRLHAAFGRVGVSATLLFCSGLSVSAAMASPYERPSTVRQAADEANVDAPAAETTEAVETQTETKTEAAEAPAPAKTDKEDVLLRDAFNALTRSVFPDAFTGRDIEVPNMVLERRSVMGQHELPDWHAGAGQASPTAVRTFAPAALAGPAQPDMPFVFPQAQPQGIMADRPKAWDPPMLRAASTPEAEVAPVTPIVHEMVALNEDAYVAPAPPAHNDAPTTGAPTTASGLNQTNTVNADSGAPTQPFTHEAVANFLSRSGRDAGGEVAMSIMSMASPDDPITQVYGAPGFDAPAPAHEPVTQVAAQPTPQAAVEVIESPEPVVHVAAEPTNDTGIQIVASAPVTAPAPMIEMAPVVVSVAPAPEAVAQIAMATPTMNPTLEPRLELPSIAVPLTAVQPELDRPTVAAEQAETISVHVGQSVVLNAPWAVSRVSITQTDIADVEVLTPQQVLVMGNELGTTDIILWSDEGYVWHARVNVVIDLTHVRDELDKIFPGCELDVMQSQDILIVGGDLRRIEQVSQLQNTLNSYGIKYVDKTSVAGVQQVMINVRVAEVSREAVRALGMNAVYSGNDFFGATQIGPGGTALNPASIGVPDGSSALGNTPFSFIGDLGVSAGITLFGGLPGTDLEMFIQALAENQYLRVLAQPTLVALSGEEASFLAGGEFPVPVVQGSTVGAGSTITIEYKEFGIRLNFLPHVLGESRIRLFVAPEVSDLSDRGAVQIDGFQIPSIMTRRAETTLEMSSGQTFAMAGLLRQSVEARRSAIPLLGDLPIIGSLFRSIRYKEGETELVVMVTASLVEPGSASTGFAVPGDLHVRPNDWDLYIDGRTDGKSPQAAPADAAWLRDMGLDQLKGPGAWAGYEQTPASSEVRSPRSNGQGG